MRNNNTFVNQFLLEFSSLWPPKMEGKFVVFWISIEKADFVKIVVFLKELICVRFEASKNQPKIDS